MSCKNCDDFQESPLSSYFRWGTANIEMRGCERHLKEIFTVLRTAQGGYPMLREKIMLILADFDGSPHSAGVAADRIMRLRGIIQ